MLTRWLECCACKEYKQVCYIKVSNITEQSPVTYRRTNVSDDRDDRSLLNGYAGCCSRQGGCVLRQVSVVHLDHPLAECVEFGDETHSSGILVSRWPQRFTVVGV